MRRRHPSAPTMRHQRGQALIEFALVAPLVLLFLFFIFDFGVALDRRIVLQHAVREAAREAAVKADATPGVQTGVAQSQNLLGSPPTGNQGTISICYVDQVDPSTGTTNGRADVMEPVKVTSSYDYHFSVPFGSLMSAFGVSISPTITLDPSATAALENEPSVAANLPACP